MRLWGALYALIWVVALEFLLAMTPLGQPWVGYLHLALGFAIVAIAYRNFAGLRGSTVPGRVKRIGRIAYRMSIAAGVTGLLVFFDVGASWPLLFGVTFLGLLLFVHVFVALAIITQVAAAAIGYDMWEEKEFGHDTARGEVPELVLPAAPGAARAGAPTAVSPPSAARP